MIDFDHAVEQMGYAPASARRHVEIHRRYLDQGGCPSVAPTKAWCNLRRNQPHVTHYGWGVPPTTNTTWTDREAGRCPCEVADSD